MTDYNAMSHQQLYSYVWSGSPSAIEGAATLNQSQSKAITSSANSLFSTLTKIQSSWSGAAAEEFTQQTNAILNQMKNHAEAAQKVYTVMNHVSSVLHWAQTYMPSPPSGAEEALADIDKNSVVGTIIGIGTFGASALASEAAEKDIEAKKATAVHVMTTLASAYTTATNELTSTTIDVPAADPTGGGAKSKGSSSGSSSGAATNAAAAGMMLPYTASVAAAHINGQGTESSASLGSSKYSYTAPKSLTDTGSTTTPTSGAMDTGAGSTATGTVTAGLGATSTANPGSATIPTGIADGIGDGSGYGSSGIHSEMAAYSTTGGLGGYGSSGLISDDDFSGDGAGGSGSYGSYGSAGGVGSGTMASGGTGTGEIGDEDAAGTGNGLIGSSANTGTSAAASGTDLSGSGSPVGGVGGMMGGMGMGRGAGGGDEDRDNRASWLKEDEDFWYSEKVKKAAPPGGLIE